MLALYVLVGTGVIVWLWLVWDLMREGRAKRARAEADPPPAAPPAPEGPTTAPRRAKGAPEPASKKKAPKRRPIGKVSYTRHRRKPPPKPAPDPEPKPDPPPKPPRDPREWTDEDYD